MSQVARQLVDSAQGSALGKTHLIIDRDTKYVDDFRHTLESAGVQIVLCPPHAPQCNAFAERFVRSIKEEGLSRLIFLSQQRGPPSRPSSTIIASGAIIKGSRTN